MIEKIKTLSKSETVKNGVTLLSASSLSQLIAIIVYPIVTRQYSPDELGVLSLFLSIVGIGTILSSGKYELAIMVEKEKKNAAAAFDFSFLLMLAFSFVFWLLLIILKPWLVSLFKFGSVAEYFHFIPLLIFLSCLGFVLTYWFNRIKRFNLSARYNIVQSATNSSLKIGFGALGFTQWGLIAASILGQLLGVISVFFRKKDFHYLFRFRKSRMLKMAAKHADFPKFTLPHAFINTLSGNLPIMILAAYFNMAEVGLFALGITMGFKPISVFTGSVNQVFFQKVTENKNNGISSFVLLKSFCFKTVYFALPFFIGLYFALPYVVKWVFGVEWVRAGDYLQLMLPWFFVSLMSSSLCFMPSVVGKQKQAMVLEIFYTILRISALFIGVLLKDIKLAILLFSLVNALYIGALLIWFLYLAKHDKV